MMKYKRVKSFFEIGIESKTHDFFVEKVNMESNY